MRDSKTPTTKQLKSFTLALAIFAAVVGGLLIYWGRVVPGAVVASVGALAALLGLIKLDLLRPVYRLFRAIGHPIGICNSYLVLTLIFILFFAPVGLLRRMMGKDPLKRRRDRDADTYWQDRAQRTYSPERFKQQF